MSADAGVQGQQPSRLPGIWTLARDVLSFAGGWVLVFMEVSRPEVRDAVLVLAGSLVTVPGAVVGFTSAVQAFVNRPGGTGTSPSPQAPVQSQA